MSNKLVPKLDKFLIFHPISFRDAARKLNETGLGLLFIVDDQQRLLRAISDGDIRRLFLSDQLLDQVVPVSSDQIDYGAVWLPVGASTIEIFKFLSKGYRYIPLLDETKKVIDIAGYDQIRSIPIVEPNIGEAEITNVLECLRTGWISSQGRFIEIFEKKFAALIGVNAAIAVSNGTVAIQLALTSLGIRPGDEVIVPDFTFAATINAVLAIGATPVLVDVDPTTWTLSVSETEKHLTKRTRALIPVHIYGQPSHCDELNQLAKSNNLVIIGDAAEALGATYKGCLVGNEFDSSTFSFFANKAITTGEGGMAVFQDMEIANRARILRDHGMSRSQKYWHTEAGFNYRLTNLQAAIGVAQLDKLSDFLETRKNLFKCYNQRLSGHELIQTPLANEWSSNSFWLYTIRLTGRAAPLRDKTMLSLERFGIGVRPGFYPLHEMPPYASFARGKFGVSRQIAYSTLSLPTYINLSESDIHSICDILLTVIESDNSQS